MRCSAGNGELRTKRTARQGGAVASLTRDTVLLYLGKKNRAGSVTGTRVIHSAMITRQVCSAEGSPRLSQKIKSAR